MYTYILNYDKNTNLKDPAYKDVYVWLEKQSDYTQLTESVYLFRSTKYSNDLVSELESLFYSSDSLNIIYLREDKDDGKSYHKADSTGAYIYSRSINGKKRR